MVSLDDIKIDSRIDPNNLDLEWREQPHLFQKYTQTHAKALKMKDKIYAQLDREYRLIGKDSHKPISETGIKAMIDTNTAYIKACYLANRWAGCVKAMDQKRIALENLVKLGCLNYFSMPREARPLDREFFKKAESEEVKDRIKTQLTLVHNKPIRRRRG